MQSGGWLPRVLSTAALTTTAVLCLTSCGGADAPRGDENPSASVSTGADLHPGIFRAELPNGASVKITVPAREPPDRGVEELRRAAEVPRATYSTVDIDNRSGRSPVSASRLVLTARDGATYQLEHLARGLKRWRPRPSGENRVTRGGTTLDAAAARALTERINAAARGATRDIPVGERGRNILVGDITAVPRDFASLELVPLIGDREVAPVPVRPESGGTSGAPDGSGSLQENGPRGHDRGGSSRAPGEEAPPENPLPLDPQPSSPASSKDPDPVVPEPADPRPVNPLPVVPDPVVPPVVPDPVVPEPADPHPVDPPAVVPDPVAPPVVPDPVAPEPVVPDPGIPDPVPTVPPAPEPEPPVPDNTLPDPPALDPVVAPAADRADALSARAVLLRAVLPPGAAAGKGATGVPRS